MSKDSTLERNELTASSSSSSSEVVIKPDELFTEERIGTLEPIAYFNDAMPTGVTVSHQGRIFISFPRWGDNVLFTVGEICNNKIVAYPDDKTNQADTKDPEAALVSVQSVVVDPVDRLGILDTGSP